MSQPQRIHAMSLTREHTATVVIDVQERLFPAMDTDHREEVIRNIKVLATSARRLRLPMFITEHCPKELDKTLQEVVDTLGPGIEPIEKVAFSCCWVGAFRSRLEATGARHIVLIGIEAHVSVLMSALDLLAEGYAVHVVADAVTSRTQAKLAAGHGPGPPGRCGCDDDRDRPLPASGPNRHRGIPGARGPHSLRCWHRASGPALS